jgi:putative membrane protein
MANGYWNQLYMNWGWVLWIGIWILMVSSFGNWGYTYRIHRKYRILPQRMAFDILADRYAEGDITLEEFRNMKKEIKESDRVNEASPV